MYTSSQTHKVKICDATVQIVADASTETNSLKRSTSEIKVGIWALGNSGHLDSTSERRNVRACQSSVGNNYLFCSLTERLFSVALDRWVSSNPLIYFETLLAQGANIWLGTQIGSDSEACPHYQQHGGLQLMISWFQIWK